MTAPSPSPGRRAAAVAAVASFLLHALALGLTWFRGAALGRRNVLTWIDFPVSLLFFDRGTRALLPWSLLAGGLQWALIGALLAYLIGSSARQPSSAASDAPPQP
jgi:hypothetical protein